MKQCYNRMPDQMSGTWSGFFDNSDFKLSMDPWAAVELTPESTGFLGGFNLY